MEREDESLARALAKRKDFFQLVLVGILLALATNLLATALVSKTSWSRATEIGLGLLAVVVIYAIRAVLAGLRIQRCFEAALLLSPDNLQPLELDLYEFPGEIARILRAAFYENRAFAETWKQEPVTNYWTMDPKTATATRVGANGGLRLLMEALETWLVQMLSTHLTDYFDSAENGDRYTIKLERKDVPGLLLENRILSLLSAPVTDRHVFLEKGTRGERPDRNVDSRVYYQTGPGNALFEKFELVLPKGSRLSRQPSGALAIDTPRLHLTLHATYEGFRGKLPHRFVSRYYGVELFRSPCLLIRIELTGHVRLLGLLRGRGWDFYRWVDSFADRAEAAASVEALLTRIGWDTVEALLISAEQKEK